MVKKFGDRVHRMYQANLHNRISPHRRVQHERWQHAKPVQEDGLSLDFALALDPQWKIKSNEKLIGALNKNDIQDFMTCLAEPQTSEYIRHVIQYSPQQPLSEKAALLIHQRLMLDAGYIFQTRAEDFYSDPINAVIRHARNMALAYANRRDLDNKGHAK